MACKHEQIQSVNGEIFCLICGEHLPKEAAQKQQKAEEPETKAKRKRGEKA